MVASRGHVVNVSSVFGIMGIPSQSIYNAAKFGVRGYTEALAIEMDIAKTGVGVHCVHPGGIATNIANFSRMAPGRDKQELVDTFNRVFLRTSPEAAAKAIIRGVEANRRRILIGPDARVILWTEKLLGSAYQRLIAATAGRFLPCGRRGRRSCPTRPRPPPTHARRAGPRLPLTPPRPAPPAVPGAAPCRPPPPPPVPTSS